MPNYEAPLLFFFFFFVCAMNISECASPGLVPQTDQGQWKNKAQNFQDIGLRNKFRGLSGLGLFKALQCNAEILSANIRMKEIRS